MVDKQLRVDAEELVEQVLIVVVRGLSDRATGNVPHGIEALGLQLPGVPLPHPPEIGQGPVIPEQPPVSHLIELGDPDAVLIRFNVLGHDIHGDFAKIQVGADAGGGGNTHGMQHIQNDGPGQFPGRHAVGVQIVGDVHHHLIDRIDDHIFLGHVFQVDLMNPGAVLDIESHSGRRHNIIEALLRAGLGHGIIIAPVEEDMPRNPPPALGIDSLYLLDDLEQPGSSRDTVGFQGGADSKADGLLRSGGIRHHQIGRHRVQTPLYALHGGVERLEVNGQIDFPSCGHQRHLPLFCLDAFMIPQIPK